MSHYKSTEHSSKERIVYLYEGINAEDLGASINTQLLGMGYHHAEGSAKNGFYIKGKRVWRILLGAFYKYFKFQVLIEQLNEKTTSLSLKRATTGMSGGLIGINQVKKEVARLSEFLQLL